MHRAVHVVCDQVGTVRAEECPAPAPILLYLVRALRVVQFVEKAPGSQVPNPDLTIANHRALLKKLHFQTFRRLVLGGMDSYGSVKKMH